MVAEDPKTNTFLSRRRNRSEPLRITPLGSNGLLPRAFIMQRTVVFMAQTSGLFYGAAVPRVDRQSRKVLPADYFALPLYHRLQSVFRSPAQRTIAKAIEISLRAIRLAMRAACVFADCAPKDRQQMMSELKALLAWVSPASNSTRVNIVENTQYCGNVINHTT
jgi:hypothetical protein